MIPIIQRYAILEMTLNPLQKINKTIHKLDGLNYYCYFDKCFMILQNQSRPNTCQDIQVKYNCYKSLDPNQVVKIPVSRMTKIRKIDNNKC